MPTTPEKIKNISIREVKKMKFREAKMNEVTKIASFVAESFGEYPGYDLVLRDAFKDKASYLKYMRKLHTVHIRANARKHKCIVAEDNGEIVAVALLQNPTIPRVTVCDYIRAGAIKLLFPIGFHRLLGFLNISEQAHSDCAKCSKYNESWYIELFAISPARKGHGIGTTMIKDVIKPYVKKHGGDTIMLVTNTEANRLFYEKNGFVCFSKTQLLWKNKTATNMSFFCYV